MLDDVNGSQISIHLHIYPIMLNLFSTLLVRVETFQNVTYERADWLGFPDLGLSNRDLGSTLKNSYRLNSFQKS